MGPPLGPPLDPLDDLEDDLLPPEAGGLPLVVLAVLTVEPVEPGELGALLLGLPLLGGGPDCPHGGRGVSMPGTCPLLGPFALGGGGGGDDDAVDADAKDAVEVVVVVGGGGDADDDDDDDDDDEQSGSLDCKPRDLAPREAARSRLSALRARRLSALA